MWAPFFLYLREENQEYTMARPNRQMVVLVCFRVHPVYWGADWVRDRDQVGVRVRVRWRSRYADPGPCHDTGSGPVPDSGPTLGCRVGTEANQHRSFPQSKLAMQCSSKDNYSRSFLYGNGFHQGGFGPGFRMSRDVWRVKREIYTFISGTKVPYLNIYTTQWDISFFSKKVV